MFQLALLAALPCVLGHIAPWDKSMFGFNVTTPLNHPEDPLQEFTFANWWFHGTEHLKQPPHPGDYLEFPAGGELFVELACDKGATSSFTSNPGGDIRDGNNPCPGQGPLEYHTTGINDVAGCAFSIAYTPASQIGSIKPEDLTIFSVNHTCVWERFTKFQVPKDMPACPEGGCTCAWHWIHNDDAGAEQMYMNGFQCQITGATGTSALAQPQLPRRCGADKRYNEAGNPQNCTYGAKQPMYWLQKERNNMFEANHMPPLYNDLYGFADGSQDDIFVNSKLQAMNWEGHPGSTGPLKAVAGNFASGVTTGGSGPVGNANSSSTPSSASASGSASGSAKPTSTGGSAPQPPKNAASAPPSGSSSSSSQPQSMPTPPANAGSDPSGSGSGSHSSEGGDSCSAGKEVTVTKTATVTQTVTEHDSQTTISPAQASGIVSSAASHATGGGNHNLAPPNPPAPSGNGSEPSAPSSPSPSECPSKRKRSAPQLRAVTPPLERKREGIIGDGALKHRHRRALHNRL